jgi:hypothetical protein
MTAVAVRVFARVRWILCYSCRETWSKAVVVVETLRDKVIVRLCEDAVCLQMQRPSIQR